MTGPGRRDGHATLETNASAQRHGGPRSRSSGPVPPGSAGCRSCCRRDRRGRSAGPSPPATCRPTLTSTAVAARLLAHASDHVLRQLDAIDRHAGRTSGNVIRPVPDANSSALPPPPSRARKQPFPPRRLASPRRRNASRLRRRSWWKDQNRACPRSSRSTPRSAIPDFWDSVQACLVDLTPEGYQDQVDP